MCLHRCSLGLERLLFALHTLSHYKALRNTTMFAVVLSNLQFSRISYYHFPAYKHQISISLDCIILEFNLFLSAAWAADSSFIKKQFSKFWVVIRAKFPIISAKALNISVMYYAFMWGSILHNEHYKIKLLLRS